MTDGGRELNRNNQPVITGGIAGVHDGIIVNHADIWQRHAELQRRFEVDSEVIFALLRQRLRAGEAPAAAAHGVFDELRGNAKTIGLERTVPEVLDRIERAPELYSRSPRVCRV